MGAETEGAEGVGEFDEVGVFQVGADDAAAVIFLLHALYVAKGTVTKDHMDEVDLVFDRG